MEYITQQIKYHEQMLIVHTNQINALKNTIKEKKPTNQIESLVVNTKEHIKNEILDQMDAEQDIIRDRIKNAHKLADILQSPGKPNNLDRLLKNEVNFKPVDCVDSDNDVVVERKQEHNVTINKLHSFTQKKQKQIISNIFKRATENIKRLNAIKQMSKIEYDESIQKEADMLLVAYLKV